MLQVAPARVALDFSETLNTPACRLVVLNRDHQSVTAGPLLVHGSRMSVRLSALPAGSYIVVWTAASGDDGHVVRDAYRFSVGRVDPGVVLPGGSAVDTAQGPPGPDVIAGILGRWFSLLAAIIWTGASIFAAVVLPRAGPILTLTLTREEARRSMWVRVGGTVAVAGNTVMLLAQAHTLAAERWTDVPAALNSLFAGQFVWLWSARQALALLAVASTMVVPVHRPVPRWLSPALLAGGSWHVSPRVPALLGVVYLYVLAASGHAASAAVGVVGGLHAVSLGVALDWIHLIAVTLWFGSILYLAVVLLPVLSSNWWRNSELCLTVLDRFSPLAYVAVGLFAVTGAFNGTVHIPSWHALLNSVYGRALIVKVVLVGLMLTSSAYTVYGLRPRLRRLVRDRRRTRTVRVGLSRLALWFRADALMGAGVLLAVSVMFFYPVPQRFQGADAAGGTTQPILPPQTGGRWRSVGFARRAVLRVAVGHRDPTLLFAGTQDGVFRYNRTRWRRVLTCSRVAALVLAPDDRTLFVGTGQGDVYRSDDAGTRWHRTLLNPSGVFAFAVRPHHPNTVLVGTGDGIYRSRDGGRRWHRVLFLAHLFVGDLGWTPDGRTALAATQTADTVGGETGILISHHGGSTWRSLGAGLVDEGAVMSLAAVQGRVFAGTMGNGVWRLAPGAARWHRANRGMPGFDLHGASLLSIPGHHLMYVATLGHGIFRSGDLGHHWQSVSRGLKATRLATVVFSLAYSPVQRALYAGTDDGMYLLAPAS